MVIKSIETVNFRNFEDQKIEFCDGINVIVGENAQGKTNLLEALWLFTGAKSFRGSKDNTLVKFDCDKAKLSLKFIDEGRNQDFIINIDNKRSAVLNGVEYKSASSLAGKICAIVFSPNDLNIIKDGPSERRRFLDTAICQLYPNYINILRQYLRAVNQRNQILKDLRYHSELEMFIEDFEKEIATLGIKIINYRKNYVEKLKSYINDIFNGISNGKENLTIEYKSVGGDKLEEFIENLKKIRKEDMNTLTTSIGPHRDDLEININGISARNFGSQGQKRSVVLALKLAEAAVLKEITGKQPIALLDDVMSELDLNRQNYILNHIKEWQVFITCCDYGSVEMLKTGKIIKAEKGKFC